MLSTCTKVMAVVGTLILWHSCVSFRPECLISSHNTVFLFSVTWISYLSMAESDYQKMNGEKTWKIFICQSSTKWWDNPSLSSQIPRTSCKSKFHYCACGSPTLTIPWPRWMQSTLSDPVSLISSSILSFPMYLSLLKCDLFRSGFPTKIRYAFLVACELHGSSCLLLLLMKSTNF